MADATAKGKGHMTRLDWEGAARREATAHHPIHRPPTAKQLQLLRKLDPELPKPTTRVEASRWIEAMLDKGRGM
jgi:hypothetical protein